MKAPTAELWATCPPQEAAGREPKFRLTGALSEMTNLEACAIKNHSFVTPSRDSCPTICYIAMRK